MSRELYLDRQFIHSGVILGPGKVDIESEMRKAGHPVHCFRQSCYWLDIGRHDDYATANDIFEARRAAFLGDPEKPRLKIGRDQ